MYYGIAIVSGLLSSSRRSRLHERSMSRYFVSGAVRFVCRRGSATENLARALAAIIRNYNEANALKRASPRRA